MIVDIGFIESAEEGQTALVIRPHPDRSTWSTVGASVQGAQPASPGNRWRVKAPGALTPLTELVALGNMGKVFIVFCTPTEVAAMVTSGPSPSPRVNPGLAPSRALSSVRAPGRLNPMGFLDIPRPVIPSAMTCLPWARK